MLTIKDKKELTGLKKALVAVATVKNWYLLPIDKVGLTGQLLYSFAPGYKLYCRSRSTDVNEAIVIASGLEYPKELITVDEGATVIDLGANIGSFLLYFDYVNKHKKYTGFAIEAMAENFKLLQKNVTTNKLTKFTLDHAAISDHDGEVFLETEKAYDAISVSKEQKGMPVKSFKLSTYCKGNGIETVDLLKMDIEGSEYEVVSSDAEFIRTHVKRFILEYHYEGPKRNKQALLKHLESDFKMKDVFVAGKSGVMYLEQK